jgi:hypothetical protein
MMSPVRQAPESVIMSKSIPQDVQDFLYTIAIFDQVDSRAFEEYARTAATLLWEKYVRFEGASVHIKLDSHRRILASSRRSQN